VKLPFTLKDTTFQVGILHSGVSGGFANTRILNEPLKGSSVFLVETGEN